MKNINYKLFIIDNSGKLYILKYVELNFIFIIIIYVHYSIGHAVNNFHIICSMNMAQYKYCIR